MGGYKSGSELRERVKRETSEVGMVLRTGGGCDEAC